MTDRLDILLVESDRNIRASIENFCRDRGWNVRSVASGFDALESMAVENCDLLLLSENLPLLGPFEVLKRMEKRQMLTPVIMLSDGSRPDSISKAYQKGSYHVMTKPFDLSELRDEVDDVAEFLRLKDAMTNTHLLHPHLQGYGEFIGRSAAMREVYEKIDRILSSELTVLVTGDSGTGKELAARTIHRFGYRKRGPFVSVNCVAIPETLQESEIFGYEQGAFTGASRSKKGKFELANNGTLFLDEIGDMSLLLQAKILRFIESGEIERVGGIKSSKVEVRLIAATNKNLAKEVETGRFREDLYHRLNVYPISLPKLTERKEDIPLLFSKLLANLIEGEKTPVSVAPDAFRILASYNWPGNVREMINVLLRAAVLARDRVITADDLDSLKTEKTAEIPRVDTYGDNGDGEEKEILPLRKLELDAIMNALKVTEGNIQRASRALGITRATMYNKIKKYNIKINRVVKTDS